MKKILVVAHCILNTAAKVKTNEENIGEEGELRRKLVDMTSKLDIQLIQLPCPEFRIYGAARWGHVKEQFMNPHYIKECRKLLEPIVDDLIEYSRFADDFEILGIVAVDGSPSCGLYQSCRSDMWRGELGDEEKPLEVLNSVRITEESGVMIEVFEEMLADNKMDVPLYNLNEVIEIIEKTAVI